MSALFVWQQSCSVKFLYIHVRVVAYFNVTFDIQHILWMAVTYEIYELILSNKWLVDSPCITCCYIWYVLIFRGQVGRLGTPSHYLNWWRFSLCMFNWASMNEISVVVPYIEGTLPKEPYLPCVSMAGRALLAGYPQYDGNHTRGYDIDRIFSRNYLKI